MNQCEHDAKRLTQLAIVENKPVLLFGAAGNGDITSFYAKTLGMNVVGFCDNNTIKIGSERCGLRVFSLIEALAIFDDPIFIVCSYKFADEITTQLNEYDINDIFLWYIMCFMFITQMTKRPIDTEKFSHAMYTEGDNTLRFSSTACKVTTICNLNCLHCAELMPYNNNPIHYEKDALLLWLSRLLESIDVMEHLSINGGEPFLYPDLAYFIEEAGKHSNILNIAVVTNGSIFPKPEVFDALEKNGVIVQTSYYGDLSSNIPEIKAECDSRGIPCFVSDGSLRWTKIQTTERFNRTAEKDREKHQNCEQRKINRDGRISRGEFHYCSLSEARVALEMIPRDDELHIDLTRGDITAAERRAKILHLQKKEWLTYCDYCASFLEMTTPAVQADGKIMYKKFYERQR